MGDNQAGYIFGFILLAFFVYITLKGELPVYAGLLLLSPPSTGGGSTSKTSGSTSSQNAAANAQTAAQIVQGTFAVLGM